MRLLDDAIVSRALVSRIAIQQNKSSFGEVMKITSAIVICASICAGSTSAFGLPSVAKTGLENCAAAPFLPRGGAVRSKGSLVKPVDVKGGKRVSVVRE